MTALGTPVVGALPRERPTEDLPRVVGEVLAAASGAIPARLLRRLPVVLAATDYCVSAASAFVSQARSDLRRLRPSASLGLEPSRLVQPFARLGWAGPCFVVATPDAGAHQALVHASELVSSGRAEAALACEARKTDVGWSVAAAPIAVAGLLDGGAVPLPPGWDGARAGSLVAIAQALGLPARPLAETEAAVAT